MGAGSAASSSSTSSTAAARCSSTTCSSTPTPRSTMLDGSCSSTPSSRRVSFPSGTCSSGTTASTTCAAPTGRRKFRSGSVFDKSLEAVTRQKLEHVRYREPICKTCNHDPINRLTAELHALHAGEVDQGAVDVVIDELLSNDRTLRHYVEGLEVDRFDFTPVAAATPAEDVYPCHGRVAGTPPWARGLGDRMRVTRPFERHASPGCVEDVYRFWDLVIEPVIEAAGARRVVEIGALARRHDGEDARAARRRRRAPRDRPGSVVRSLRARRALSRAIRLPSRHEPQRAPRPPPVDVALVDGDHNWYTVYHELRMLAETARIAARPLPVIIMHDVLWPYGRRDLYYDPRTIPEEFRQPYEQRGMAPGVTELLKNGGLNPTLHNAVREGGPRNGVMTALEDFLGERGQAMRTVIVPFHFGLAIVVDEERLAEHKQLVAVLDELESAGGRYRQLELAESVGLGRSALPAQRVLQERTTTRGIGEALSRTPQGRAARRALPRERSANRVSQALREPPGEAGTHQVARPESVHAGAVRSIRSRAEAGSRSNDAHSGYSLATMGRDRLEHLHRCLDVVRRENVAGDLVECGTGRGGGAIFMRGYLAAHEVADKDVWLADEFRGLAGPRESHGTDANERPPSERSDLNLVREAFVRFDLLDDRVRFLQGEAVGNAAGCADREGGPAATRHGSGTSDTRGSGCRCTTGCRSAGSSSSTTTTCPTTTRAVDEFRVERQIDEGLEQIDFAGAGWRKLQDRRADKVGGSDDRASRTDRRRRRRQRVDRPLRRRRLLQHAARSRANPAVAHAWPIRKASTISTTRSSWWRTARVRNRSSATNSFAASDRSSAISTSREDATPSPAPALNRGIADCGRSR